MTLLNFSASVLRCTLSGRAMLDGRPTMRYSKHSYPAATHML